MNREIEVERGMMVWDLMARPSLEHAAEVWWPGGKVVGRKSESVTAPETREQTTLSFGHLATSSITDSPRVHDSGLDVPSDLHIAADRVPLTA